MFNWFKSLFSSDKTKLQSAVLSVQTIVVPTKTKAYHEIVPIQSGGFDVRVYDRASSSLMASVETPNKETAQKQALVLLSQYNKE